MRHLGLKKILTEYFKPTVIGLRLDLHLICQDLESHHLPPPNKSNRHLVNRLYFQLSKCVLSFYPGIMEDTEGRKDKIPILEEINVSWRHIAPDSKT